MRILWFIAIILCSYNLLFANRFACALKITPNAVEIRDFSPRKRRASASLDGDSPREQEKSRISGD